MLPLFSHDCYPAMIFGCIKLLKTNNFYQACKGGAA